MSDLHEFHRKCAVELFNHVWDLMEKVSRSEKETQDMIHSAHASRYHWSEIGEPIHFARGEWQISRVYALLDVPERALYHGENCLDYCKRYNIGDFDLAYAYEAIARSYHITENQPEFQKYIELAIRAGNEIENEENKELFESDMASLKMVRS